VGALVVTCAIAIESSYIYSRHRGRSELARPAALLAVLVAIQVTLGALTVLSQRNPWINSFHVVCGALVLTTSLVLTLRSWRVRFSDETVRLKADTTIDPAPTATDSVRSVRLQPDRDHRSSGARA
jgi:heme a synthase